MFDYKLHMSHELYNMGHLYEAAAAHFQATELRGFELLVQGIPAEQVPVLVPRICGVCSTAHHLAAVKALVG